MTRNPYTPPDTAEAIVSEQLWPRPISAWLLVFALLVTAGFIAIGSTRLLYIIAFRFDQVRNPSGLLLALGWRIAIAGALLATAIGIFRRRQWGRWLGLASILIFAGLTLWGPDTTSYANDAERTGGTLGRLVVIPLLLAWWAYAFGFSSKARRYFASSPMPPIAR